MIIHCPLPRVIVISTHFSTAIHLQMGGLVNTQHNALAGTAKTCLSGLDCCNLPRPHGRPPRSQLFTPRRRCLSLFFLSGFEAHFIVSVRCKPVVCLHSLSPLCQALTDKAIARAPISLLQLRWLFLDSIPPLISSSEISLYGSTGPVVGYWGLEGREGVG